MIKVTDLAKVESSRPAIQRLLQELNGVDDSVDNKNGKFISIVLYCHVSTPYTCTTIIVLHLYTPGIAD